MTPDDRKYAKTHEWAKSENHDRVSVGISDHAQDALGDITFVELPEVGQYVEQGEECAVVESVKAASDIFSPISGTVCEVNNHLDDEPEMINRDPYEDGWIYKLKNIDTDQLDGLMDAPSYDAKLTQEAKEDA